VVSTPPLISFLLARGASPHATTHRGLTPLDLVSGMQDREDVAMFLDHSALNTNPINYNALQPTSLPAVPDPSVSAGRQALLHRRRDRTKCRMERFEKSEAKHMVLMERERYVREKARVVDVDPELLLPPATKRSRKSADSGMGWMEDDEETEEETEDSGSESEDEGLGDMKVSRPVFGYP
jgi:hypothetical protein